MTIFLVSSAQGCTASVSLSTSTNAPEIGHKISMSRYRSRDHGHGHGHGHGIVAPLQGISTAKHLTDGCWQTVGDYWLLVICSSQLDCTHVPLARHASLLSVVKRIVRCKDYSKRHLSNFSAIGGNGVQLPARTGPHKPNSTSFEGLCWECPAPHISPAAIFGNVFKCFLLFVFTEVKVYVGFLVMSAVLVRQLKLNSFRRVGALV